MLDFAKKGLVKKALDRPDLAKQVVSKARTEGILEAYQQATHRLDTPVPLGYSSAGVVTEIGSWVEGLAPGDRVACAGSGYASHAELIAVPSNLCVKVPPGVSDEQAAFVALGGIALEAVRLAEVSLGDRVVVIGLGLLGQIAVQLLKAAGCHVFGTDLVDGKVQMAIGHGAEAGSVLGEDDVITAIRDFAPNGADAAIIMAATQSNQPLELAAQAARDRGRVVAAGLTGLDIPRELFFDKELEFTVSRAWGPGLFDPTYTEQGIDYPYAYPRWTARRNMEEFLAQLAAERVQVDHLITHRYPIDQAEQAYELILKNQEPYMGVLMTYPNAPRHKSGDSQGAPQVDLGEGIQPAGRAGTGKVKVGVIGAGQFASTTLLPLLQRIDGVQPHGIATTRGHSAHHAERKFGFVHSITDYQEILTDTEVDVVFVLTRHGSHARFVSEALAAGKHVFTEKPLALDEDQLRKVVRAYEDTQVAPHEGQSPLLLVGFNRRFAPLTAWLSARFARVNQPLAVHCTVNAGTVPGDHWIHDPVQGGGRIIGEICHFVDLIQHLTGGVPIRTYAESLDAKGHKPSDNVAVTLKMSNGALGTISYVAGGDKSYPRERVEVFGGGAVGTIENFRSATFTQKGHRRRKRQWLRIDRGHPDELEAFFSALKSGSGPPVSFEDHLWTTMTTFAIERSLQETVAVNVDISALWLSDDSGKEDLRG